MLSKRRAELRARASLLDTIITVGKNGLSEEVVNQTMCSISARELIKGKVLDTAMLSAKEAAQKIAKEINAEVVCSIGNKFVLYKEKPKSDTKEVKKSKPKKSMKAISYSKKIRNNKKFGQNKGNALNKKLRYE